MYLYIKIYLYTYKFTYFMLIVYVFCHHHQKIDPPSITVDLAIGADLYPLEGTAARRLHEEMLLSLIGPSW